MRPLLNMPEGDRMTRRGPRYRATFVDERPEVAEMTAAVLYIAGNRDTPFCAAMLCPCGCGDALYMSLVEGDRPRWRVKVYLDGTPTVPPSISASSFVGVTFLF